MTERQLTELSERFVKVADAQTGVDAMLAGDIDGFRVESDGIPIDWLNASTPVVASKRDSNVRISMTSTGYDVELV